MFCSRLYSAQGITRHVASRRLRAYSYMFTQLYGELQSNNLGFSFRRFGTRRESNWGFKKCVSLECLVCLVAITFLTDLIGFRTLASRPFKLNTGSWNTSGGFDQGATSVGKSEGCGYPIQSGLGMICMTE